MRRKLRDVENYLSHQHLTGVIGEYDLAMIENQRSGFAGSMDLEFDKIFSKFFEIDGFSTKSSLKQQKANLLLKQAKALVIFTYNECIFLAQKERD